MFVREYHRQVGDRHDPYGETETLIRNLETGKQVRYIQNGLGLEQLRLTDIHERIEREVQAHLLPFTPKDRQALRLLRLKMNLLSKRHVGMTLEQAQQLIEGQYAADPFQGRDPYYGHS